MTALTLEMTMPEKAFVPPVWHSKKSDEHPTPQRVFDNLDREFGFTLDPCATVDNAKCDKFYTQSDFGNATENAPFPSMIVVFRPGMVVESGVGLFKGVAFLRGG
ncbi:MAG: hypothetical protein BWK73_09150 [Thiothrix lacustris]|uniref:Uncharacterized protein n=1 Tax=Thiothrix lacustris TaxID=525917 RepID=A0A1Y1QVA8_9GAMM|nr:MAG: hypothetical protein BWK73_09150 [Thiothrix lacustris]